MKPEHIWEQIALEKELQGIVDRIVKDYNVNTPSGIAAALRQAAWEGMCKAKEKEWVNNPCKMP